MASRSRRKRNEMIYVDSIVECTEFKREHTGKGADYKGTKQDGLFFTWNWVERGRLSTGGTGKWKYPNKRKPCQTCEAILPDIKTLPNKPNFVLEAIMWGPKDHRTYEASVQLDRENITSKDGFKTRLEAQKAAENLLVTFLKNSLELLF